MAVKCTKGATIAASFAFEKKTERQKPAGRQAGRLKDLSLHLINYVVPDARKYST